MEWQSEQQTKCPICQEDNIHRPAQNSWKCDNLSCGVEWGKTRCTTKCKEWFYWIQPGSDMVKKLRFQDVQCDTPCEAIQMHENIFDRYVITDFEIEPDEGSGNVKIYPICPICGGRRKRWFKTLNVPFHVNHCWKWIPIRSVAFTAVCCIMNSAMRIFWA